ncbi:MAG: dienelactone hydrolase family protein [Nannocystis sp.]|nr:dienelactone hydrolase family protein [Nannocystis sp.]
MFFGTSTLRPPRAASALFFALMLGACGRQPRGVDCVRLPPTPGEDATCRVPEWKDRDFIIRLPSGYDGASPLPVVVAMHGGGGDKEGMNAITCAGGDEASPACLSAVAEREGFIVVYPDGFANPLGFRSWNHGGDGDGLHCSYACKEGVDDVAYVRALLDEIARVAEIDPARIYATGFSNGGGMSHRLACELADRFAAFAPVGGANQFALSHACAPSRAAPILAIHGSDDPCWPYAGGEADCLSTEEGAYAAVEASMIGDEAAPGWASRHGCELTPEVTQLPDADADGNTASERSFTGCAAPVLLITVDGAGHTWPGGDQYLDVSRIGGLSRDFAASERVWSFLRDQRLP